MCRCTDLFKPFAFEQGVTFSMQIYKRNNRYLTSAQCSAGLDALIEIKVSNKPVVNINIYSLSKDFSGVSKIDPEKILDIAKEANEQVLNYNEKPLFIEEMGYVPEDSPHYDLINSLAVKLLKNLCDGAEVIEIKEKGNN